MVFLVSRMARVPIRASRAIQLSRPVAAFHSSPLRAALSESDRDHPDAAGKTEHHKEDSLKKQKEGKGEHKDELASDSESALKHDKHDLSVDEMQKQGAAKGEADK